MKTRTTLSSLFVLATCFAGPSHAQVVVKLHDGGMWSNQTTVPSVIWSTPAADQEAADDFDVVGTITRVVANGNGCFQCVPPELAGVWVRFYAWQSGAPGALQAEEFVSAGSPGLLYNTTDVEVIDVTLSTPFEATGLHFVSVQAEFVGAGYWAFWICDYITPTGSTVWFKDELVSPAWGTFGMWDGSALQADLDLELWGHPPVPPVFPVDPCGPWEVRSPAAPADSYHTLVRDLKTIAIDDVWVVGDATVGTIGNLSSLNAAWHWDGTQWTSVPVPNPAPGTATPNNGLSAIDAAGPDDVYAVGYQSITVPGGWYGPELEVLHWDGSQWSMVPGIPMPPTSLGAGVSGAHINDVSVVGHDDVWFAGFWLDLQPSGIVTQPGLLMHYDGSDFTLTPVPVSVSSQTGLTFTTIEAIAADDVWATGFRHGFSTPMVPSGIPPVLHWDGSTWEAMSPPIQGTPSVIADIAALGPKNVWLLGYHTPITGGATPFMVHWNGSAWTTLPAPPSGASLRAFAPNDIYAGGNGVWRFDGASWTAVQSFPTLTSASFATIDGIAPCHLWGAGGQWSVGEAIPFAAQQNAVWQNDLGYGGPNGPRLGLCGGDMSLGTLANLLLFDAPAKSPALLVVGLDYGPTPLLDGTLVPVPWTAVMPMSTNANGSISIAGIEGGGGPIDVYLQFLVRDKTQPMGIAFSNAVRAQLLP